MFDVGFWELVLLGVIALIVLGPERLPEAARTLGRMIGKARSYANGLSQELENHAELRELRDEITRARDEMNQIGERVRSDAQKALDDVETTAHAARDEVEAARDDAMESVEDADDDETGKDSSGGSDADAYVYDYLNTIPEEPPGNFPADLDDEEDSVEQISEEDIGDLPPEAQVTEDQVEERAPEEATVEPVDEITEHADVDAAQRNREDDN